MEKSQITDLKPGLKKPAITAQAFADLKLTFIMNRLNQFAERRKLSWEEIQAFVYKERNGKAVTDEIDLVVDQDLHSSKLPDITMYEIY